MNSAAINRADAGRVDFPIIAVRSSLLDRASGLRSVVFSEPVAARLQISDSQRRRLKTTLPLTIYKMHIFYDIHAFYA
jgi:hypothetical protein